MITLTVDDATLALLKQATGLAEIRDASGAVVGFFAPISVERARQYAQAAAQIDPVELQRRKEAAKTDWAEIERRKREEPSGRTTREVFEHLQSITEDAATRAYLQAKIDALRERDGCATP